MPNLEAATVLCPDVDDTTIAARRGGEAAAQKAGEAYAASGRVVSIMRPTPPHKDFNAELMAVIS